MQNHTRLLYDLIVEYCNTLTKKNCCLDDINIDMSCSANIHNDYKTTILHKFIKKTNKVNLAFSFETFFIGTTKPYLVKCIPKNGRIRHHNIKDFFKQYNVIIKNYSIKINQNRITFEYILIII